LCTGTGISVVSYRDDAEATMVEDPNGAGRFVSAVLRPRIMIQAGGDLVVANRPHHDAHEYCFIANSVNFPVSCEPFITFA
jgi:organic hydroperoxide reductase OsmC/OhrA